MLRWHLCTSAWATEKRERERERKEGKGGEGREGEGRREGERKRGREEENAQVPPTSALRTSKACLFCATPEAKSL